jgi:predicted nuclease of restriction endonuclease-like (RecB) superfamily
MVVLNDNQHIAHLNADFANVLDIIQGNRSKAVQAINHASVMTAWHVGAYVSNKIKNAQWGAKVVQQLAEYIHTQDPTLKGWSKVTIYRMVKLYDTYSSQQFVSYIDKLPKNILANSQQLVSPKMTQIEQSQIVSAGMTQIPNLLLRIGWTNHQIILQRCSMIEQYIFYILYAEYEHLQNKELERAIKADTYSRMLNDKKWQSEMLKTTYPQTQLLLKDKAILEFLGLPKQYKESRLRKGIVEHMREFIVELGKDFLFVDEEHALEVGGKTYRCDLLFFHRALQCLVAIELKTTEFDPRDLGQLEFYLEALDQTERRSNENPSIGILMCKDANSEVVRYALNRSMSPTMVAMYEEHLKVGSVLQRSLEEFTDFLARV